MRVDSVHPTLAGQKYMALMIAYMFEIEHKNVMLDWKLYQQQFGNQHKVEINFNVFERNELWIHPNAFSLPPILFKVDDTKKQKTFEYLANVPTIEQLLNVKFDCQKCFEKCLSNAAHDKHKSVSVPNSINVYKYISVSVGHPKLNIVPTIQRFLHSHFNHSRQGLITQNGIETGDKVSGWRIVSETKQNKIGLICNETNNSVNQCKLSISILLKDKRMSKIGIIFEYLQSYKHMGKAVIWVDCESTISDDIDMIDEYSKYAEIDGLNIDDHTSQTQSYFSIFEIDYCQSGWVYFHLQMIHSQPQRLENKFKIISLIAFAPPF